MAGYHFIKKTRLINLKTYDAKRIAGLFPDSARSDHKPYWDEGIPAVMITDTANFRNPHYHIETDTAKLWTLIMSDVIDAMIESLITYK